MRLQVQVILTAVLFWNQQVYADDTKVKSSTRIKEIAPVFRRNPYRSSTTTPTTTEVDVTTSEVIEAVEDEKPSIGNFMLCTYQFCTTSGSTNMF